MASLIVDAKVLRMWNAKPDQASRKIVLLEVAYKLFVAQVYRLCLHLLANDSAAEDATVKVFARFNRELPRRWDEQRVRNQLREFAIDEAVQRLYGDVVANASRARAVKVGAPPAPDETGALDTMLVHKEQARLLDSSTIKELTARMPVDLRVAFVLHDMEGLKEEDVARHLRVHESKVRALVKRARLELRRLWLLPSGKKGDRWS